MDSARPAAIANLSIDQQQQSVRLISATREIMTKHL